MLPPALYPNKTTIAVATPASSPKSLDALTAGVSYLQALGYAVKTGRLDFPRNGYLSGTDELRADELNGFIADPEVSAIFCTRGGYGSARILSRIDYQAARANPKLLVGYSDITALQLALYARASWKSLSGPMIAVEWGQIDKKSEKQFWQFASGAYAPLLQNVTGTPLLPARQGVAEGTLLGGNLTVLTKLIGTPFLPSLEGAILFIEDVNEPAYKVDALLAQLKLSGIWDTLGGLIIGQFTDEDHPEHTSPEINEVFQDYCNNVSFPVASGLRYGHIPVKNTMPIGVRAQLTVKPASASLFIREPIVAITR